MTNINDISVKHLSFDEIKYACEHIGLQIHSRYHHIISIKREGIFIASVLSHILDVPILTELEALHMKISNERILLVDDAIDTGNTIKLIYNDLKLLGNSIDIATLYIRHSVQYYNSIGIPITFYYQFYHDLEQNIVYPWQRNYQVFQHAISSFRGKNPIVIDFDGTLIPFKGGEPDPEWILQQSINTNVLDVIRHEPFIIVSGKEQQFKSTLEDWCQKNNLSPIAIYTYPHDWKPTINNWETKVKNWKIHIINNIRPITIIDDDYELLGRLDGIVENRIYVRSDELVYLDKD